VESVVKYVFSELGVIEQAPVSFSLSLICIAGVIWKIISWRYTVIMEGYEARSKLQADQIADYKNKLSGASPDEAKARLDGLEANVAKLAPRSLSDEQSEGLIQQLSHDPGRANITLAVSSPNAKLLHASLERCFRKAGYVINTWITMETKITHDHIGLKVPIVDQLTQRQTRVLTALRKINLEVFVEYEPDHPANEYPIDVWLVIR